MALQHLRRKLFSHGVVNRDPAIGEDAALVVILVLHLPYGRELLDPRDEVLLELGLL
jgi:hypothetical protein